MVSIAIVSPNILPLLLPNDTIPVIGGIEVQEYIIARHLMDRARITFITFDIDIDQGQLSNVPFGLVTFPSSRSPEIRGRRILNALRFVRALRDARADVFFMMGSSHLTGLIAFYCILKRKRFVFQIASQNDLNPSGINGILPQILNRIGITYANCVLAQTETQRREFESRFGRKADVVSNPVDLPEPFSKELESDGSVIWVGTIRHNKRPDLFIEIAADIPTGRFVMFGPKLREEGDCFDRIQLAASKIPNLQFRGFITHKDMLTEYRKAGILVNTSDYEGFPNTFLESWSNYAPVISLRCDPDEVICRNKLGFHSRDIDQMKLDIIRLMHDRKLTRELGSNGRRYVETHHSSKVISDFYEEHFTRASKRKSGPAKVG